MFLSFLFKSGVCHSFMLCNLSSKKVSVTVIKKILNMIFKAKKSLKACLGWDKTKVLRRTSHLQCIITSSCQLYCQFSLMNLCCRESLCDKMRLLSSFC